MQQESSGEQFQDGAPTTSPVGAMGLMQVMPDTYDMLRIRYGLGNDPYEPHDNIFAGTAYIREMYDTYGFPGFLAAYNAGPQQLDACLANGAPLPWETVSYLSAVAPKLRTYAVISGPLAGYADAPPEIPADDLNRRSLTGQPMPQIQVAAATPALACMPPAADRSADALNRDALAAAAGDPPDSITDLLNRQTLAR
jgi:D-alanyl-D-alanine carboxypeptidase